MGLPGSSSRNVAMLSSLRFVTDLAEFGVSVPFDVPFRADGVFLYMNANSPTVRRRHDPRFAGRYA